jgi:hypothetical protein
MIAALDMDSITLDPGYQPPAIMDEMDSASAFDIDVPVVAHPRPVVRAPTPDLRSEAVTLTDLLIHMSDPGHALAQELSEKANRAQADLQAYQVRIEALGADAVQDGYGLNRASERDFWHFVRSEPFIRKGNLVLMDNGNLRAVWRGENGTHIGLQFLGGRTVQYVIFKQRAAAGAISRVAGRDSFEGVKRQIAAFDLRPLIYA